MLESILLFTCQNKTTSQSDRVSLLSELINPHESRTRLSPTIIFTSYCIKPQGSKAHGTKQRQHKHYHEANYTSSWRGEESGFYSQDANLIGLMVL